MFFLIIFLERMDISGYKVGLEAASKLRFTKPPLGTERIASAAGRQEVWRYVFEEFVPEVMQDIKRSMSTIINLHDKGEPKPLLSTDYHLRTWTGYSHIQNSERNATSRYLTMTTIATFFSGITATTLQFSFMETNGVLDNMVNFFWFSSLVFSISSAINSLLGMTWRKSSMCVHDCHGMTLLNDSRAAPGYEPPRWLSLWLDKAPMVFLLTAAFAFMMGLAMFTYSTGQVYKLIHL